MDIVSFFDVIFLITFAIYHDLFVMSIVTSFFKKTGTCKISLIGPGILLQ